MCTQSLMSCSASMPLSAKVTGMYIVGKGIPARCGTEGLSKPAFSCYKKVELNNKYKNFLGIKVNHNMQLTAKFPIIYQYSDT